jgi:hypothetical protein
VRADFGDSMKLLDAVEMGKSRKVENISNFVMRYLQGGISTKKAVVVKESIQIPHDGAI